MGTDIRLVPCIKISILFCRMISIAHIARLNREFLSAKFED